MSAESSNTRVQPDKEKDARCAIKPPPVPDLANKQRELVARSDGDSYE